MASHLASLWKWDFLELGNGLLFFAIVAKEIIEKNYVRKSLKCRKNRKNNKCNKIQDLEGKKAKKGTEKSANVAKIAKVTRIFLAR